ncbi:MAG TPA: fibronectin type III domain-containing protein [Polyangiaceae bacterium]|nr:fibronectin type III domain-containing protein [Polyangiaceae bacterium]
MTLRGETTSDGRHEPGLRPAFALFGAAALSIAATVLSGCGSDGNNVTCGKGTVQKGDTCVAKSEPTPQADASAGGGPTTDAGAGGAANTGGTDGGAGTTTATGGATGTGGTTSEVVDSGPPDVIVFKGVLSAAPGESTPASSGKPPAADSIRLAWELATYPTHPLAALKYEIYAATSSGMENYQAPIAEAPAGSTSFLVQGLDAKKNYFVVRAVPSEGDAKDENTVELAATPAYDDTAPSAPSSVKVASATSTAVTLSWKAGKDDDTPSDGLTYNVYWGTKTGATTTLGAVSAPGETTATVAGLPAPKTTFYFRVVTVDAAGNVSTNKDDFAGKTSADVTPPVFGGCYAATDPTAGGATVVWTPAADDTTPADAIRYDVYAFEVPVTRDTPFDKIQPTATFTGGTSGQIQGLKNGTTYRVVCRAEDSSGNQDDNRVTQVFTTKLDGTPPTFSGPNTDPSSYQLDSTMITLSWAAAMDDQTDSNRLVYYVYTSTTPGGEDFTAPPIAKSDPGVLTVPITGLLSNTQYYFVVRAVDEAGNIDQNTNELALTTLVSFENDVQPIFTANCALSGCHVPGNPPQGQILSDGFSYNSIVDVMAGESGVNGIPPLKRIDSTNPDPTKSYLYLKITGASGITGNTMPPPDPTGSRRPLTETEKNTIKLWIVQGAKNN